jgi:hypothetical protein
MEAKLRELLAMISLECSKVEKLLQDDPDNAVLLERNRIFVKVYFLLWETINADELSDREWE